MRYAVGIDIGGTNTRVALIDESTRIIKREQFSTDANDPEKTMDDICEVIKGFNTEVCGIGLSCPGPLDLKKGIVLTPPNLPGWHGFLLVKVLSEKSGLPVFLENDANLACLAEASVGAGRDYDYVQFLTVSTGLGAGFCVDKKIYIGSKGFAQEVANCILWKDGPSQGELKKGSIESISSGTAIVKRAREADLDVEHAGNVYELAKAGNSNAAMIMEDACEYLSSFIAILYAVLDPEIFVLGGSVALKIPGFIEEVEKRAKDKVYASLRDNVRLVRASLSEDCGLVGAACLVFQKI